MNKKPKHLRPDKDFRVTSIDWEIDIERRHREAGFEPVPLEVLHRRFFQFIEFLQSREMTTRIILKSLSELTEKTEFRNSDLTDKGFYFVQQYHGRWLDRTFKDKGEMKENGFLQKWYKQFEEEFEIPGS